MKEKKYRGIVTATIPVMVGYIVLGTGFGIILRQKGFGILWAFCMSFFIYAGAMEYVAIDILTMPFAPLTVALTTLAVNSRHLLYGVSMLEKYKNKKSKILLALLLTDETYALVCTGENSESRYLVTSILNWFYWVLGSVLGNAVGGALSFSTEGVDFALTALFVSAFTGQIKNLKAGTR